MGTIFIGIALIAYSNIYGLFLQALHLKNSLKNVIIYMVTGFLIASLFLYFNYGRTTIGAVVVIIICAIGSAVRIMTINKNPSANN